MNSAGLMDSKWKTGSLESKKQRNRITIKCNRPAFAELRPAADFHRYVCARSLIKRIKDLVLNYANLAGERLNDKEYRDINK